jgi:lipooligosaccharide transport system ATP-binding protein
VSPDPLIEGRRLTKRFGEFVAVDAVDFRVEQGEAFGFLGPNGAGKTSTMRMIGCISPVSDGELRVLGMDPATDGTSIRARLGVVPQEDTLDLELTVRDNVLIYGRYFDLPRNVVGERADELLEFVQLTDRRNDRVDLLSGGMRRRLTVARALVNRPELMLLDEPTTGLDPQARHLVWERLYRLKRQGVTLVLTTHYMDEAEQLCDRLVIMDDGQIVAAGSPRSSSIGTRRARSSSCGSGPTRSGRRLYRAWQRSANATRHLPTASFTRPTGGDADRLTNDGVQPTRCWSGAARSRTSS